MCSQRFAQAGPPALRRDPFPHLFRERLGAAERLGLDLVLRVLLDEGAGAEASLGGLADDDRAVAAHLAGDVLAERLRQRDRGHSSSSTMRGSSQVGTPPCETRLAKRPARCRFLAMPSKDRGMRVEMRDRADLRPVLMDLRVDAPFGRDLHRPVAAGVVEDLAGEIEDENLIGADFGLCRCRRPASSARCRYRERGSRYGRRARSIPACRRRGT